MDSTQDEHKILGVQWNVVRDKFVFDVDNITLIVCTSESTKRNVVSMATRFYDPLGVVSPVTILFDEPLSGDLLAEWNGLVSALQGAKLIVIPRC